MGLPYKMRHHWSTLLLFNIRQRLHCYSPCVLSHFHWNIVIYLTVCDDKVIWY